MGETLAAMDAAARRAAATEPSVREALDAIERDEAAHAALAWRTLRWILADDDGALAAVADRAFTESARLHSGATVATGPSSGPTASCPTPRSRGSMPRAGSASSVLRGRRSVAEPHPSLIEPWACPRPASASGRR